MNLLPARSRFSPAPWGRLGLLAVALLLAGCDKQRDIYVLTSTGKILGFDSTAPDAIDTEVSVSGLGSGESLVQIDYRPSSDSYYCLTSEERLCTVNPDTGAVSLVSTIEFTSDNLVNPVIDFNPVADLLRVVASQQNLRVNPDSGALAGTDTDLEFDNDDDNDGSAPQLAAIAYDNNQADASSTTLYGLDFTTQSLVRVGSKGGSPNSPNSGLLFTVAPLGTAFTLNAGFDIAPEDDTAYAALAPSGSGVVLYRVDLSDGSTDRVGEIDDGERTVIDLVVGPERQSGG
ncbi:MAG: DUF4394 domain-containing protein [Stagnimonas sp.]|nr:DUF4394 domain-containing protein [Stagnimonas sp.]